MIDVKTDSEVEKTN